jgi:acyl-CoA synthetase (NDP forming)
LNIITAALEQGRNTLNERESKEVLKSYGIPVTREIEVTNPSSLVAAVREIGFPTVLKACSHKLLHKSEKGLVIVDIRTEEEAFAAFQTIQKKLNDDECGVLVQEMIKGQRELVMGFIRDPQFGPCVMFGLGGIFTEIMKDVSFRPVPLSKQDCIDMMHEIKANKLLGSVRGLPPVDLETLSNILISLGKIGMENDNISEVDINPLIISGNGAVAVDAVIVVNEM